MWQRPRRQAWLRVDYPDPSQLVAPLTVDTASAFNPKAACEAAVPAGYHYFNLQATRHAFPETPPTAPAAWCTGFDGVETYVYYVVSRDQPMFVIGTEGGIDPPQPGPPHIE